MRIGSLFSGIGGLELGLEASIPGARTVWQVERDGYARGVLARHWPDADRSVTDVRQAGADRLAAVDLICGGFPCQDVSNMGRREGLRGSKSGLWFEFRRVLWEMRPRFVVVENVQALLGRGLAVVRSDLAALGYVGEWQVVSAGNVGAPQGRPRVLILAYANSERCEELGAGARGREVRGPHASRGHTDRRHAGFPPGPRDAWRQPDGVEPGVRGTTHGVSRRMDRVRCLGNAVVPAVAAVVGRRVAELTA